MGQGEGVKGAGEEGHLLGYREGEGAVVQPPQGDEAVNVSQGGGAVEEGHVVVLHRSLLDEEEELAVAQGEQVSLLVHGEDIALKQQLAGDQQSLLAHRRTVVGQSLEQETQQLLAAGLIVLGGLHKAAPVGGVVLEQHSDGVQRAGDGGVVGGAQQGLEPQHLLVQLAGVEVQGGLAQIFGDVLGNFVLSHLQTLAQLHDYLVALVPAEHGQDMHQSVAGVTAHHHPLRDLDEVGVVGADVEHVLLEAVLHLVPQQLHAHHLDYPGGGGLQVVQKDLAGDVLVVERPLVGGGVLAGPLENAVLQEGDGQTFLGDPVGDGDDLLHLGVAAGEIAGGFPQEHEGGHREAQVVLPHPVGGKVDEQLAHLVVIVLGGEIPGCVQQGEGGVSILLLGVVEVAQEGAHKPGHVPGAGVLQQGLQHQLQGVADVVALLLGSLVVGVDEHVQVLLPKGEGDLLGGVVLLVRRHLLAVDQVETGNDQTDERAGLTADIALAVDQQLVEEGERLSLLAHRQVGEVLLEHVEVGPQLLPVLGGAGGLNDVAELALVGEHVHQAQAVAHRQQGQTLHRLSRSHEGGVLVGTGLLGLAGEVHVHAQGAHVVLKIVELAVDELIPPPLGGVHVLQLGEDDLEGLVQGVEDGDLVAVGIPALLGAEVGVDETQRLHRQRLQLQIPGGVVGGDVADVVQMALQQPLVGVVVVQVGHPLSRAAAELADVVGGGGAGNEGQIDVHPGLLQSPGHRHGDVVDPGNVAQRLEGGDLQP